MTERIPSVAVVGFVIALVGLTSPSLSSAASPKFTFEIFTVPGDGQIIGNDIYDGRDIAGDVDHFTSGLRKPMGFVRRGDDVSLIDFPSADFVNGTHAGGINNLGQVVGRFTESTSQTHTRSGAGSGRPKLAAARSEAYK